MMSTVTMTYHKGPAGAGTVLVPALRSPTYDTVVQGTGVDGLPVVLVLRTTYKQYVLLLERANRYEY
jgi:hypothetical protein